MRPDETPDLDFDPWEDTTAERPIEHQDPFDDGTIDGPLGVHAEVIGVPRLTAGTRQPRRMGGSPVPVRMAVGGILVVMFGVPLLLALWQRLA